MLRLFFLFYISEQFLYIYHLAMQIHNIWFTIFPFRFNTILNKKLKESFLKSTETPIFRFIYENKSNSIIIIKIKTEVGNNWGYKTIFMTNKQIASTHTMIHQEQLKTIGSLSTICLLQKRRWRSYHCYVRPVAYFERRK